MTKAGTKMIEGAKEALSIAKGERPAAVIWHNGFAYYPEETLRDPNAVHVNMLNGRIATPSVEQIRHIYGDTLKDGPREDHAAVDSSPERLMDAMLGRTHAALRELAESMRQAYEYGQDRAHESWLESKADVSLWFIDGQVCLIVDQDDDTDDRRLQKPLAEMFAEEAEHIIANNDQRWGESLVRMLSTALQTVQSAVEKAAAEQGPQDV